MESKTKTLNLLNVYKEKLEQVQECKKIFYEIRIPSIYTNLQASIDIFSRKLTEVLDVVDKKITTLPERESGHFKSTNFMLTKSLGLVDTRKDLKNFINKMRPNIPDYNDYKNNSQDIHFREALSEVIQISAENSLDPSYDPVFGKSLEYLSKKYNCEVPPMVSECIKFIETHAIDTTGIYRISGSARKINMLKKLASINVERAFSDENVEIHAITGLLKTFFRDLPVPLIDGSYLDEISFEGKDEPSIEDMKSIVSKLSNVNACVFRCIVRHLRVVSDNSQNNQMTLENISMIWSQTLFGNHSKDNVEQIVSMGKYSKFLKKAISHYYDIFPDQKTECLPSARNKS